MSNTPHGVSASLNNWSTTWDPAMARSGIVNSQGASAVTESADSSDVQRYPVEPSSSSGFPSYVSQSTINQAEAVYFGQNDYVNPTTGVPVFVGDQNAFGDHSSQEHLPRIHATGPDCTWPNGTSASNAYGVHNNASEPVHVGTYMFGAYETAPGMLLGSHTQWTRTEHSSQPISASADDVATDARHAVTGQLDDPGKMVPHSAAFERHDLAYQRGFLGSSVPQLSHPDTAVFPELLSSGPAGSALDHHPTPFMKLVPSPSGTANIAHSTASAFDGSRLPTSRMQNYGSSQLSEAVSTRMQAQAVTAGDPYVTSTQIASMPRASDEPNESEAFMRDGNGHVPRSIACDFTQTLRENEAEPDNPDGRRHRHAPTSAPIVSGVSKPDILGEPSAVLCAQDDSVQPDILAEPILHQPRQYVEGKPVGTGSQPVFLQEAGQGFADPLSCTQHEQHSVAIGYEPISPHSQSAFTPVATSSRLGRTEGLLRDPTPPALWQNDAPLQTAILLQPVGSSHSGPGDTSAVSSLAPANSLHSASVAAPDADGKDDKATVLHDNSRTENAGIEGAAALQMQVLASNEQPAMSSFDPDTGARAAGDWATPSVPVVVPHPVPVPVFVQSPQVPRDTGGLLSNFSPGRHDVGPEMLLGQVGTAKAEPRDLPPARTLHAVYGTPEAFATGASAVPENTIDTQPTVEQTLLSATAATSRITATLPTLTEHLRLSLVSHGIQSGLSSSSVSSAVTSNLNLSGAVAGDVATRPPVTHGLSLQKNASQQLRTDVAASQSSQFVEPVQMHGVVGEWPHEVGQRVAAATTSGLTQPLHDSRPSAPAATLALNSGANLPGSLPADDHPVYPKEDGRPAAKPVDYCQPAFGPPPLARPIYSAPGKIHDAPTGSASYVEARKDSVSNVASHHALPGHQRSIAVEASVDPAGRQTLSRDGVHAAAVARSGESGEIPVVGGGLMQVSHATNNHLLPNVQRVAEHEAYGKVLPHELQRGTADSRMPLGAYAGSANKPATQGRDSLTTSDVAAISAAAEHATNYPPARSGHSDFRAPTYSGSHTSQGALLQQNASAPGPQGYPAQSGYCVPSGIAATNAGAEHAANYPPMPLGNADIRSPAYNGLQLSQGALLQQHASVPGTQGYPAQSGYGVPSGIAGQQQPYDRRAPSAPPVSNYPGYGDYFSSHLAGNGYNHYVHQDPYGGYFNRGYGYDRQPHSYYDYRGSYQRGYMEELNAYAQQQAAAAYGSLYDYYQQCQQYYNAMQENHAQSVHSRSSSRAVTPAIRGQEQSYSYADSSYYPSRPESAASVGALPSSSVSAGMNATVMQEHDTSLDGYISTSNAGLVTDVTNGLNDYYHDNNLMLNDVAAVTDAAQTATTVFSRKTPACFPLPHARVSFGKCGQLVTVLPTNPAEGQPAVVQVHDLRHFFEQPEAGAYDSRSSRGLVLPDHANLSFPLIRGQTHKKDVIDFCDRQADKCRTSVAMHDRESSELMWRFLALLIKQNGTFIGSDVAELLLADQESVLDTYKRHTQTQDGSSLGPVHQRSVDVLTDRYRELLLYGHVKEALDYAVKNELWGHALFLASKMDSRTQANVIARFTTMSMRSNDPLQTLYQLMSNKQPSVVTSIADDKWGSWRPHLAMMLVNGSGAWSDLIKQSIVQLGDTLSGKGQLVASQFCYIMAGLPFDGYNRKSSKLSLLGAHPRMSEQEFLASEHVEWTEVYEYAQSLGNPVFAMASLQTYKLVKAWNLLECGNVGEALRYCEAIAEKVLGDCSKFCIELVKQLIELSTLLKHQDAEALHSLGTSGGDGGSPWIDQLSAVLERMEAGGHDHQFAHSVATSDMRPAHVDSHADASRAYVMGAGDASTESIIRAYPPPPAPVSANVVDDEDPGDTVATANALEPSPWTPHQSEATALPPIISSEKALPPPYWAPVDHHASQYGPPTYGSGPSESSHQSIVAQQQHQYVFPQRQTDDRLSSASDDTAESSQSADEDSTQTDPTRASTMTKTADNEPKDPTSHVKGGEKANASKGASKGIIGRMLGKVFGNNPKTPKPTEMKLPDDKEKTIVWDETTGRWVNTAGGSEEETPVGPPPMSAPSPGTVAPFGIGRGRRAPTYVDPFKGTASVARSPLPSLLNDGFSGTGSFSVLTPVNVTSSSQNIANGASVLDQQLISRNESSASLEVQTIMSSSAEYSGEATAGKPTTSNTPSTVHATSGQPAAPALVPAAGPAFYNPMQFSQSTIPVTAAKRLSRRV